VTAVTTSYMASYNILAEHFDSILRFKAQLGHLRTDCSMKTQGNHAV